MEVGESDLGEFRPHYPFVIKNKLLFPLNRGEGQAH